MKRKIKYEEICLYCKYFEIDSQECSRKRIDEKKDPQRLRAKVSPFAKAEEQKCKGFKKSEDAAFAFSNEGIGYFEKSPWSKFKREQLLKRYEKVIFGS